MEWYGVKRQGLGLAYLSSTTFLKLDFCISKGEQEQEHLLHRTVKTTHDGVWELWVQSSGCFRVLSNYHLWLLTSQTSEGMGQTLVTLCWWMARTLKFKGEMIPKVTWWLKWPYLMAGASSLKGPLSPWRPPMGFWARASPQPPILHTGRHWAVSKNREGCVGGWRCVYQGMLLICTLCGRLQRWEGVAVWNRQKVQKAP